MQIFYKKGIKIPSKDREDNLSSESEEACIYGTEYYELEDVITEILKNEVSWYETKQDQPKRVPEVRQTFRQGHRIWHEQRDFQSEVGSMNNIDHLIKNMSKAEQDYILLKELNCLRDRDVLNEYEWKKAKEMFGIY